MSPDTVMKEQKGSCFEMSTLLVSFLIGSGYDAYVVSGYATREICVNDLSRYKCPLLIEEPQEEEPKKEVEESKYVAKPVRDLRSKFLLMMAEREEAKKKAEEEKEMEEERLRIMELEKPEPDPLYGWRVHSWVLVLPGKREIKKPFFIESASGMSYDIADANYLGVESIWNNANYWVNLQICTNGCEDLDWDLTRIKKWEHVLVGEPWDQRVSNKDAYSYQDDKDSVLQEKHLDMPMSWVNQIELPNDRYEQRYPNGSKSINYYKAMCDLYAPYLHRDGLIWRIITYLDYEQINPEVIHECYKYREDCLQKKVRYLSTDETYEFYKRGRDDCIKTFKSYITDENQQHVRREIDFYYEARYDGLRRLEMSSEHMLEEFKGRDDRLFRRYVSVRTSERRMSEDGDRRTYKYVKEDYERNPSIPADEDIASREFCLLLNQIVLKYHYGPDKVTAAFRRINKPPISDLGDRLTYDDSFFVVYKPDPFAEADRKVDLYLLMVKSLQDEEMTLCHIRGMEDELYNMIHTRSLEAAQANLTVSIFDELRNEDAKLGMKELERAIQEKSEREVEAGIDFLAPYLIGRDKDEVLPYDLALQVREKCLENYKQTLVNRANRMKINFEELSMKLSDEDMLSKSSVCSEDQETCSERKRRSDIIFQLHILEKRLERHKETAARRYKAVEECLKYDKRLSAIHKNK
ncbi:dynein regulatory complex subunit 7 [Nilaparvata lugens]|uniref:dynein regulatory complex subunit 7 n=1 Tax=Nilaparvata lugens TaxID=108931 RepID=UPI00193EBF36|nr:dynein regulatory complex subunit 7 [Nilaparvata lugens]